MNHINKLQIENASLKAKIAALENGFNEIRSYLNLPKLSQDIMVNKNDIILRIDENVSYAERVENDAWIEERDRIEAEKTDYKKIDSLIDVTIEKEDLEEIREKYLKGKNTAESKRLSNRIEWLINQIEKY